MACRASQAAGNLVRYVLKLTNMSAANQKHPGRRQLPSTIQELIVPNQRGNSIL